MDIENFRDYCINKKGVTESFPFDQDILVFKLGGKIFAFTSLEKWESGKKAVNLKCDPEWSEILRSEYEGIIPGYHMNKKHWNTVYIDHSDVPLELFKKLIDHSYELVIKGLPKKIKEELQ